jgi:hypothetical protein
MTRSLRLVPLALALACNGGANDDTDTDTDTDDPIVATAAITPQAPCSSDDLVVEVDGGRATAFRWTVDGVSSPETTNRIASNRTTKGQLWEVEVDVEGAAAPASASVTVVNCGPTVSAVSLSPTDPARLDAIVGEVQASDPDGDALSVTWRWLVDGETVNGADTDMLNPGPFRKGQLVIAEVVVSDGELASAAVQSAAVTVVNTPPTAAGISLDPEEPLTGDDLVCGIDTASFDVDDDAVTYGFAWTVDGAPFSATTTTVYAGDTVPASATEPDQEWQCTVTPSDGDDLGPASTAGVVIGSWADVTFTTCGQSGRTGPSQSQCDGSYSATPLAGLVTVVSGVQTWKVPDTGTYTLTAYGAEGGEQDAAANKGGRGAVIRATLELTAGETLQLIVGQRGGDGNRGDFNGAAGGGGGTGIADSVGRPLLIAGGGGGGDHDCGGEKTGGDGRMSTSGGDGSPSGAVGRGGTNGNGGSHPSSTVGGAGAGYYTNGQAASGREGLAPGNGGLGGTANDSTNFGGFGGGGGTGGQSAGGGGGYSGGGASENCYAGIAGGGGGSFVTVGALEVWTSDGTFSRTGSEPDAAWSGSVGRLDLWHTGHGQITITR